MTIVCAQYLSFHVSTGKHLLASVITHRIYILPENIR